MKRWIEIVGAGIFAATFLASLAWAGPGDKNASRPNFAGKLPIRELNEEEAILHALNRLGFGPRPGLVEQIEKTGLENWIQAQLHPENISDPVVDARLAQFPSLRLGAAALLDQYPPQDAAAKRLGISVDDYRKRLQDQAKQPAGSSSLPVNSLPFKDQNDIVNEPMESKLVRAVYSRAAAGRAAFRFLVQSFQCVCL